MPPGAGASAATLSHGLVGQPQRAARDRGEHEPRRDAAPGRRASSSIARSTVSASKCSRAMSAAAARWRAGSRSTSSIAAAASSSVGEREQPLARRERRAEAGVLRDHRAPGGEVGRAAVAEPARAQADVLVLGDGELAARVARRSRGSGRARPRSRGRRRRPSRARPAARGRRPRSRSARARTRAPVRGGQVEDLRPLEVLAPV